MADRSKLTKGSYYVAGRFPVGTEGEHKCPVCEQYIFESTNSLDICDICHWQDCVLCENDPDYMGGPNATTLNQAREYWEKHKKPLR